MTGWLDSDPLAALAAVEFMDLAVDIARHVIVDGEVTYPVAGLLPPPLRIEFAGFTLVISRFSIFALRGFRASASVILPPGVTDAASCGPAVIDLGRIALSPTGDYFFDEPDREYGPWLLGERGWSSAARASRSTSPDGERTGLADAVARSRPGRRHGERRAARAGSVQQRLPARDVLVPRGDDRRRGVRGLSELTRHLVHGSQPVRSAVHLLVR